jgi:hypothetical protein
MNNPSLRFAGPALRGSAVALAVLLWAGSPALAQVSIGIATPGVSIGINLPVYPSLVRVPGYPVYYAPGMRTNFFFYDGMYWVYQQDNWYASSWYNGPWSQVGPDAVPLFVLRVPVRYYRNPPQYFRDWRADAPPRWGEHWGNEWSQQHGNWDHWDRHAAPAPAPLPAYQRRYSGSRYPQPEQQHALRSSNYRYQPHEAVVQQHFQQQAAPARAPEQQGRAAPPARPQHEQPPQHVQPPQPQGQRAPEHAERREQGEGQAAGKGRGAQEKGRDNEGEGGRQGNK